MNSKPLFGSADPLGIAAALSDPRFFQAAFLCVGLRDVWERATDELSEVYQRTVYDMWDGAEVTPTLDSIHELILVLAERTKTFADRGVCCARLERAFIGMPLPLRTRIYETDEDARKRRNKEWLANYHATKKQRDKRTPGQS